MALVLFSWIGFALASSAQDGLTLVLSWGNATDTSSVLIMTCHSTGEVSWQLPSRCCTAMTRAADAILEDHPSDQAMFETLARSTEAKRCEEEGSIVPPVLESSLQFIYQRKYLKAKSTQVSNVYVWSDKTSEGLSWQEVQNKSGAEKWRDAIELFSNPMEGEDGEVESTLTSELSQSGGMHRTMDHNLTIALPERSTDKDVQLKASFLLLVPTDFFMDAEDAFEDYLHLYSSGATTLQYEFSLHSDRTIDIEQPSFSSPQHAVVIQLHWDGSIPPTAEELVMGFSTKIHLRYPSPVVDLSSLQHVPIQLMPPILLEGRLSDGTSQFALQPKLERSHLLQFLSSAKVEDTTSLEFLITTVASAPEEDFVIVAALTVVFSVLGAAFLGYETSRIVH